ncbi:phospholipase D-like domain-containing protein [Azospirillum sp. B510]|uniref:phospholipase D-like domain-containing protein n=1 Tax=Azospirillum sp. (strain B510) TaxID=137722 RepID=UPI0011D13A74|nr:phospholipase D-like domain-containing protein [Azospirillum sp. B510]
MPIAVKARANADDVMLAWKPDPWSDDWAGFAIERRDEATGQVAMLANRIPPQPGSGPVRPGGVSSALSPIRRCIWIDHGVPAASRMSYRVTPVRRAAAGGFSLDKDGASDWSATVMMSGDAGDGLAAYFNRGTLMSQVVSRFVRGDMSRESLHRFLADLANPGFAARRYLSGEARHEILSFIAEADRRGSTIHIAIYEMNDRELVESLKPFGARGHVLLGNGGATEDWVERELADAGLDVRHRDLSHAGRSSPSVHNKFVIESDPAGRALRVLTGSMNWTTTGLCTQLNNVLIMDRPTIAARYLDQWEKLVAAGDAMPTSLKTSNGFPTKDGGIALFFAATQGEAEFQPVLELIRGAEHGALFLMFTPGQSPLLGALLDRARENRIYLRGVVSRIQASESGDIVRVGGEVVKSGASPDEFHHDVVLPAEISEARRPSWAEAEFNVREMLSEHLMAIVHSKVIVVDPFSDKCAVVTGSHNFSPAASQKNDENLVIVRGNRKLAQAYALHINTVYDHYSWRAFLAAGGNPDQIYKPLDGWKPGGSRARELDFWMS